MMEYVFQVKPGLTMAVYGAPNAQAAGKRARASFPDAKAMRNPPLGLVPTIGAVWEPTCPTYECSGPTRPNRCGSCQAVHDAKE